MGEGREKRRRAMKDRDRRGRQKIIKQDDEREKRRKRRNMMNERRMEGRERG